MIYLLDTHYMVWTITDTKKLSKKIRNIITDSAQEIIVSAISFWEISLKHSLGKLDIKGLAPESLPQLCKEMNFGIAELSAVDGSTYHRLKATYHKDPFDRMLIWQAISNNYTLISADSTVKKYVSEGLKVFVEN